MAGTRKSKHNAQRGEQILIYSSTLPFHHRSSRLFLAPATSSQGNTEAIWKNLNSVLSLSTSSLIMRIRSSSALATYPRPSPTARRFPSCWTPASLTCSDYPRHPPRNPTLRRPCIAIVRGLAYRLLVLKLYCGSLGWIITIPPSQSIKSGEQNLR